MITPDAINSFFLTAASLVYWNNVLFLYRHKEVRGVFWPAGFFSISWGLWSVYYYHDIVQWWSCLASFGILTSAIAWTGLAAYYTWKKKYGK